MASTGPSPLKFRTLRQEAGPGGINWAQGVPNGSGPWSPHPLSAAAHFLQNHSRAISKPEVLCPGQGSQMTVEGNMPSPALERPRQWEQSCVCH